MRKLTCALPLLLTVGMLLAATPFNGRWKMNHQKSRYTRGDMPREEIWVITDQGDHLRIAVNGADNNGAPIAISYIVPMSGGAGQMQQGGSYDGVTMTRVNDRTRDVSYTKNGQELVTEHMLVSTDGKTMLVNIKGVDSSGQPVDGVLVLDQE